MEMMRLESTKQDRADRMLAQTVACPTCSAKPRELCHGPGVWDGNKPVAVHVGRLKIAVPHPRPQRFWWLTAHDEFMAGGGISRPGFDNDGWWS